MTSATVLRNAKGVPVAVTMTFDEYLRLDPEAAERHLEISESADLDAIVENDEFFPAEVVNRIMEGESPVRVYREYRGLTQGDLADRAEVSNNYISMIETGRVRPSRKLQYKLAAVLGVDYDDLDLAHDDVEME